MLLFEVLRPVLLVFVRFLLLIGGMFIALPGVFERQSSWIESAFLGSMLSNTSCPLSLTTENFTLKLIIMDLSF